MRLPWPGHCSGCSRWPSRWRGPGSYGSGGNFELAVLLIGLASTVPLALLWAQPTAAAVVVSAASVLSLTAFHALTAAALVAQLAVLYRAVPAPGRRS